MELLAHMPGLRKFRPGLRVAATDFPDLEIMLARRRPPVRRATSARRARGLPPRLRTRLGIVSTVRLPIVGPRDRSGCFRSAGAGAIDRPDETLLAVMQRFADQVAIAWYNALRLEAQREPTAYTGPSSESSGSRRLSTSPAAGKRWQGPSAMPPLPPFSAPAPPSTGSKATGCSSWNACPTLIPCPRARVPTHRATCP